MCGVCSVVLADTMAWLVFLLAVVVMGDDTIAGVDKDDRVPEDNSTYEALPTAEEWRNAPSCPLWGPMDSFYKDGIEKGRVGDEILGEIHQAGLWWPLTNYSFILLSEVFG